MGQAENTLGGNLESFVEAYERFLPGAKVVVPTDWKSFRWSGKLTQAKGRSLWHVRLNRNLVTQAVGDKSVFGLIVPMKGQVQATVRQINVSARLGQALILHLPEERNLAAVCSDADHVRLTVTWRISEWKELFDALYEDTPEGRRDLNPVLDFSKGNGGVFFRLLDAIAYDMTCPADQHGLASALMNEALLRMVFEKAQSGQHRGPSCRALPRHVRQAIEYMRANIGKGITIRDAAVACGVTVRTLEAGFRAHLGTTPLAYLRQMRLRAVHKELMNGKRNIPISTIARCWGFVDMGRFSARYRRMFGELPSETLRKR